MLAGNGKYAIRFARSLLAGQSQQFSLTYRFAGVTSVFEDVLSVSNVCGVFRCEAVIASGRLRALESTTQ